MDAGGAAELDPVDKFVERHFVFHLQRFSALVQRNDPVPRVTDKTELKVVLELPASDVDLAFARQKLIERAANPVGSSTELRPRIFHQRFDLHEIEMRNIGFAEN